MAKDAETFVIKIEGSKDATWHVECVTLMSRVEK